MISTIIVDYKSMECTIEYIIKLNSRVKNKKILKYIVVDNSCEKDNLKFLTNKYKNIYEYNDIDLKDKRYISIEKIYEVNIDECRIFIVKNKENMGYARANNLGALIAKEIFQSKYYIFSNNDIEFTNDIDLNMFISIFEKNKNIGIIGPKIVGINNEIQSPRKKISIWKKLFLYYINMAFFTRFNKYISDIDYTGKNKYAYWVSGSFFIVDSDKFHKSNMFDNNTFLYAEEMILSERMIKNGYKTYFINDIEIIHKHGQTTKNTLDIMKINKISFESNLYYFYKYRNTNNIVINLSKLSYIIFTIIYPFKTKIKKILKKIYKGKQND